MARINGGTRAHAQVLGVNADLGLSNGDSAAVRRTFDSLIVKSQLFFLADRWEGVFLRRSIKSVFESTGVDDGLLNGPSCEKRPDAPV